MALSAAALFARSASAAGTNALIGVPVLRNTLLRVRLRQFARYALSNPELFEFVLFPTIGDTIFSAEDWSSLLAVRRAYLCVGFVRVAPHQGHQAVRLRAASCL